MMNKPKGIIVRLSAVNNLLSVIQQTIIHIDVCAVYLHKSSVKFTNLFLGSPYVKLEQDSILPYIQCAPTQLFCRLPVPQYLQVAPSVWNLL